MGVMCDFPGCGMTNTQLRKIKITVEKVLYKKYQAFPKGAQTSE